MPQDTGVGRNVVLDGLDFASLRRVWEQAFGAAPPRSLSRVFMRRVLAYERQCRTLGWHSATTRRALAAMVNGTPGNGAAAPAGSVAVRADMDALPVTEDTDLPFKSTKRGTYNGQDVGIMHACGHDIHTAVQMGVASVLIDLKADIPGTVLFIFQPAEEGPPPGEEGGAELMVREGVFDDTRPEAVFGLHALANLPVGQVALQKAPPWLQWTTSKPR